MNWQLKPERSDKLCKYTSPPRLYSATCENVTISFMRDFGTKDVYDGLPDTSGVVEDVQLTMPNDIDKEYWVYGWLAELDAYTGNVTEFSSNFDKPLPVKLVSRAARDAFLEGQDFVNYTTYNAPIPVKNKIKAINGIP